MWFSKERAFYLSVSSAPLLGEAHNNMIVKRKEKQPKILWAETSKKGKNLLAKLGILLSRHFFSLCLGALTEATFSRHRINIEERGHLFTVQMMSKHVYIF